MERTTRKQSRTVCTRAILLRTVWSAKNGEICTQHRKEVMVDACNRMYADQNCTKHWLWTTGWKAPKRRNCAIVIERGVWCISRRRCAPNELTPGTVPKRHCVAPTQAWWTPGRRCAPKKVAPSGGARVRRVLKRRCSTLDTSGKAYCGEFFLVLFASSSLFYFIAPQRTRLSLVTAVRDA